MESQGSLSGEERQQKRGRGSVTVGQKSETHAVAGLKTEPGNVGGLSEQEEARQWTLRLSFQKGMQPR